MKYFDQEKNKKQRKDDLAQILEHLINGQNGKARKLLDKVLRDKVEEVKNENI
jgi:hypothetical protein